MKTKLDTLIDKNSAEFSSIIEMINAFIDLYNSDVDLSTEEASKTIYECVNGLSKIAEYAFEYGKFKDRWKYDTFYQNVYGPELIIASEKTKCGYRIGIDENGVYLSCELRHNVNLCYMGDPFWKTLLELSEFEGFQYSEHEFTSKEKEFPKLFRSNKSMIFRIMRKHFFDITNKDMNNGASSVGQFKITWTSENSFEYMVRHCCEAFKKMYQLNYQLWKESK